MALDLNSFANAMKVHYTDQKVAELFYKNNPLLAMMPKYEQFGGSELVVPVLRGNPQNRSQDFATAQAAASTSKIDAWHIKRVHDYSFAFIDNETILASKGQNNAFMEAASTEIDGALNALTRSIAQKMYRSGWGDVGKISGAVTGTTITLSEPADVVNFEVDQVLQFASTQGASGLKDAGDSVTVTAVDRSNGTLTVFPDLTNVSGLASGDFIFLKGDRQNSASPARLCISGLQAWIPDSAPTSGDNFFGVDRSKDPTRLAGLRLDATAMPIEEALISGMNLVGREGGGLTHYFMNYAQFSQLEKALGTRVQYADFKGDDVKIGFRGLLVQGPTGAVKVVADPNCQIDRIWGLQMDDWRLNSLGKLTQIFDTDGKTMLRQANADGVEVRIAFYGNMSCKAPGRQISIKVAPATI